MSEPSVKVGDFDLTVKKISYSVPISCCLLEDVECNHPTRTPWTIRRWVTYKIRSWWYLRPRVHLGPCNHDDCC